MKLPGKKINCLAAAFAIPCVGMLFVMLISGFEPFGEYSMLFSDMYHQYYPFFVAFRDAIREGKGLIYTWSVGLGMDYLGMIAYYLASPLNLLSVFIPDNLILEYFSLLVPIKLGFAGMFFAIFLKHLFDKDDFSIAVFGGFYGLCAWALGFQWNVMWLDTFALLPLVALGTVKLLQEKKFMLYTLSLFFSIFINYYIGFFTCIFVFLLFFIYEFCRWGGWKKFWEDFLRIAIFSVLAIGMTCILELPALAVLQSTQSSVNKFPTSFRLNIAKEHNLKGLLDAMRQVAGNMGGALKPNFKEGLPNVYCGIISVFMMMLYLTAKKIPLRDKICAVVLLGFLNASFVIRQLDYIWHGFHFTNMIPYRFSFLYSFVVLYMAYRAWLMRKDFSAKQIIVAGVLAAVLLACSEELTATVPVELGSLNLDVPLYFLYNLVFLVLYLLAMLVGCIPDALPEGDTEEEIQQAQKEKNSQHRRSAGLLLTVMVVELAANLICFGLYFTGTNASNYPKGTDYTASVIRYMKERERNNLFFRAEMTHTQTLNDGALNDYNGVSAFTSSANVQTTYFMQSLGYGAKNTYNRYAYEESSPVANLFLGLKYMIDRDDKDKSSAFFMERNHFGQTTLLENRAYLPLGFLAAPELEHVVFDTSGSFDFQNELFAAATGIQDNVWQQISGENLTISPEDAEIVEEDGNGYCKYRSLDKKNNITYQFTAQRDGFACIHLDLPKRNDYYVSIDGVELYRENISLPQMIAVGDVSAGDVIGVRVVCKADEDSNMTIKAAVMDNDLFWKGYDILNASTLELTTFESDYVKGIVRCDRDGLLYTSIPQNGNWSVKVDGKPADVRLVGDCMIGVSVTEGQHLVEFIYRNSAFALGWKISLLSAAAFAAVVYQSKKKVPEKKRSKKRK